MQGVGHAQNATDIQDETGTSAAANTKMNMENNLD